MRTDPYADAPRLPDGDRVDPRTLVDAGGAPVELEIGPGRGWFMVERLEAEPGACIIGLEIRRKWATIVDRRLRQRGLGARGRVFAEDARTALRRFPDACIAVVYLHFPDPWWKKRHQKRLVIVPDLVAQLARVLASGGELFVQSDVIERVEAYEELIGAQAELRPWGDTARIEDNPYGARSPRERRAIQDGLPVVRLRYRKTPAPA